MCCVGWENGDLLAVSYPERQIMCRHSTTNNDLVFYNTTVDSSGSTARGDVVVNDGSYSATSRPWYKAGRDCGRYNNSHYGKTCVSPTYVDSSTGITILTLVQPFYDADYTLLGNQHYFECYLNCWVCRSARCGCRRSVDGHLGRCD